MLSTALVIDEGSRVRHNKELRCFHLGRVWFRHNPIPKGRRREYLRLRSAHGYQEKFTLVPQGTLHNHFLKRQCDVTMAPFKPDTVKGSEMTKPPSSVKCQQPHQV